MNKEHQSEFLQEEFDILEPESYEDQIIDVYTRYFSRFEFNLKKRVERLEYEVDDIRKEIEELKESKNQSPLVLLSNKLKSQGTYAVLKDETYEVLLITYSRREALNFSSNKKNVFILRLR